MKLSRITYFIGIALGGVLASGNLRAGESAVLVTGYALHVDRHESDGDRVRLFSGEGVTELPATAVARFDADAHQEAEAPGQTVQEIKFGLPKTASTTQADFAAEAAQKTALPESFVRSVMKAESNFVPTAVSPKGAIGLMQLMPGTAVELGVNPLDPRQNAEGGARYLRELLEKYQNDPDQVLLALAAYNAGPAAVEKYHGVPPYNETRRYILRVLKNWKENEATVSGLPPQASAQ